MTPVRDRAVALWLFVCAAMIFAMVVIGGITRLTESGLSIVDWLPLAGAIPPLSEPDWQALYERYKTSPQFRSTHLAPTLGAFKTIFWWEYVHRLWGRLIAVVFLVPFAWFLGRGQLHGKLAWKCAGLFALGALQGVLGWWMVASGLMDRPEVSHYRLVAHLGLALLIYALTLRLALALRADPRPNIGATAGLRRGAGAVVALVALSLLAGGLVAGLDAGMIHNTFPLMAGRIVPPEYGAFSPWWRDALDNPATVQFHHRVLAVAALAAVVVFWWRAHAVPPMLRHALLVMALVQAGLGIATLLLYVPVTIGAAHQAGALALFTLALLARHAVRP